eukprot:TRINITY_DN82138_c0_g1_i1.p1 TRINITY_DN82138_c0_g1~~TRINITY_DN82138_c0_g1_i1.p1  ORF type:complete len:510 (-),score=111.94 TRINITY_DN82138_c0_g1_i1:114-1643(-)
MGGWSTALRKQARLPVLWYVAANAQQWETVPAQRPSAEAPDALPANTHEASLEDLRLAAGKGYVPLVGDHELRLLLEDHLIEPREVNATWERPPRRTADGDACAMRSDSKRQLCQPPDASVCIDRLLPVLLQEVHHAMSFVKEQVNLLEAAAQVSGTSTRALTPPLAGRALASMQALDAVVGLFLGVLERVDFNPALASCFATPLGHKIRESLLETLEQQKRLSLEVQELRWELAAFSRLAHARYGLQWHADSALHIASQAGWAIFNLAKLDGYFSEKLGLFKPEGAVASSDESQTGNEGLLLQEEETEIDRGPDAPTDWALELRTAMHTGGELWHLDKGLLRFLLAEVLQRGDIVCDLGAFGGHYSAWLNDTGLVTAVAFDGIPGIEKLSEGHVRHARIDSRHLDLAGTNCDVVLCLEVLEHISREREMLALRNLGYHTRRTLVASWAPPWIPGPGHINQRTPTEGWTVIEETTGLQRNPEVSEGAKMSCTVSWIRESIAIFERHQEN